MIFYRAGHDWLIIQHTTSIISGMIGAHHLFPKAPVRNADTIVMTYNRGEVTDHNDDLFLRVRLTLISNHTVLLIGVIYPTEALVFKLILIKRLFTGIKSIEIG